jgi:hypothetical protein
MGEVRGACFACLFDNLFHERSLEALETRSKRDDSDVEYKPGLPVRQSASSDGHEDFFCIAPDLRNEDSARRPNETLDFFFAF